MKRFILTVFCVVATTAAMSSTLKPGNDSTSFPLTDGQCAIARHIEVKIFCGKKENYSVSIGIPSDMSDSVQRILFIVDMKDNGNGIKPQGDMVLSEEVTLSPGTSHSAHLTVELRSVEELIQLVEAIRECSNTKDYKEKSIQEETRPIKKTRKLPHGVD